MPLPDELTYEEAVRQSHCPSCNEECPDGLLFCDIPCLYRYVVENEDLFTLHDVAFDQISSQVVEKYKGRPEEEVTAMLNDLRATTLEYAEVMRTSNAAFQEQFLEIIPLVFRTLSGEESPENDALFTDHQKRIEEKLFAMRATQLQLVNKFREYAIE